MRFKGLDLNLLVAFDALLDTRSVSRSADQLNLSQPAMSAALARLRDFFGDDLLVLQGKRMHPTAFAEELAPQVKDTLAQLKTMLEKSPVFDPATSQRVFRIVTSDYVLASIIVPLVAQLAREAPGIRIDCLQPQSFTAKQIDEGGIDMMISPEYVVTGKHPAYVLYEEPQMVVGAADNPMLASGSISEDDFFAAGHVAVILGEGRTASYADRQLERHGRKRRIEVTSAFFTALPWLIEGTNRVGVIHARLARQLQRHFAVKAVPLPFSMPPMQQMLSYHAGREDDAGLAWLRGKIEAIVAKDE